MNISIKLISQLLFMVFYVAFATVQSQASEKLPNILILGNSISLGYTPYVTKNLSGKAKVFHPAENCEDTGYSKKMINSWLQGKNYEVIYFNWGIWDAHMLDSKGAILTERVLPSNKLYSARRTSNQYIENLQYLISRLKANGAKLIFATSTPIYMDDDPRSKLLKFNNIEARKIMGLNEVQVDDLYAYTKPNINTWQSADEVHFNEIGNASMGKHISQIIANALDN